MKTIATIIAAILMLAETGAPGKTQTERTTGCVSKPATIVSDPHFVIPEGTTISVPYLAFDLDIGSDAQVRKVNVIAGTGNKVTDAMLVAELRAAQYAPAQTGCVAASSVLRYVTLTHAPPSPGPEPTPIVLPQPATLTDACVPLVDTFIFPVKRDRAKTGFATVAVPIDASGAIDGQVKLVKSTGSAILDQEAIRIAATGKYRFMDRNPCRPQPITYFLDLRFE